MDHYKEKNEPKLAYDPELCDNDEVLDRWLQIPRLRPSEDYRSDLTSE